MKKERLDGLSFLVGTTVEVTSFVLKKIGSRQGFVLLPTSLNDLASRNSDVLRKAYQRVDYCVTDGVPLVWFFNFFRKKNGELLAQRVYGPTLMADILKDDLGNLNHFFYGSSAETIQNLLVNIKKNNKALKIVGQVSPPFRPLSLREEAIYLAKIKSVKANVLWIGLSSPKQVILAVRWSRFLPGVSILCVGAAFDFLAKRQLMAPRLVQNLGFEWLFRLLVDPKRLWRRYLITIPKYLLTRLFGFS